LKNPVWRNGREPLVVVVPPREVLRGVNHTSVDREAEVKIPWVGGFSSTAVNHKTEEGSMRQAVE
jgi:hypothetical protein